MDHAKHKRTCKTLAVRGALLAGMLALAAGSAFAGPADDVAADAVKIQEFLDQDKAAEAERLARDALVIAERYVGAATAATANIYRLLGDALFEQKRFAEAEPMFRKALSVREQVLGSQHLDTARSAGDLAVTLKGLKRYDEAEQFYRQALAIRRAALGPGHADVARSQYRLAMLYDAKQDYRKAAEGLAEAIEAGKAAFGADDRLVVVWSGERAAMLHDAGALAEAEPAYRSALAAAEKALPADDPDLSNMRQGLANLLVQTDRPEEAEALYRAALTTREKVLGPDHPNVASSLARLARVLMTLDRPSEAEQMYHKLMAFRERNSGPESPEVADAARMLANALQRQEHTAEAEIYFKRALAISEMAYGPDNLLTGLDMLGLGVHYAGQQRFREAEPLLARAVAIIDKAPKGENTAVAARVSLAYLKSSMKQPDAAIALLRQALAEETKNSGAASTQAADIMVALAFAQVRTGQLDDAAGMVSAARAIYADKPSRSRALVRTMTVEGDIALRQGRAEDARRIFADALARIEERYGADSVEARTPIGNLGAAYFALGDHAEAARLFERSVRLTETIADIDTQAALASRTGEIEDDATAHSAIYEHLVKSYDRLAAATPGQRGIYAEKAFLIAQRVGGSQAAAALGQMAQRQAAGSGALARLVRERQDLLDAWRVEDRKLVQSMADAPETRDAATLAAVRAKLESANQRIHGIDRQLRRDFPAFAELQKPSPSSIADVQASLAEDQVLLFFAETTRLGETGFETYLWAVPKRGDAQWIRLATDTAQLSANVRTLRGLMGVGVQTRGAQSLDADKAKDRTAEVLAASQTLYSATLAPVQQLIDGKSLLIVPSPKLSGLPFHLLVAGPPPANSADRYKDAHWLVRDHAITVLPSVSSLTSLASGPTLHTNRDAYLGFANPLLTGRDGGDRRAFARQACADAADAPALVAAADIGDAASFFRGASADVDLVRRLAPLPETTDEACAIARALGSGETALRLGQAATEEEVKRLSADGTLERARLVHFATHGLVSGDLNGLAEPAIVLTPPAQATALDDGLLTASEVTTLKLDADWVILSACNTASGDGGGEALSGLARAFFYAGSRALMVSHWPVNSDAAVNLVTGAVDAMAADPSIDRAEALRRAMLTEIEKGGRHAEPANWAPFVLVGAAR